MIGSFRYQINPDGISYLSIADKYSRGEGVNAINGYWSPLLSWLLIPFLKLGIEPILSFKILNLIIGLTTLMVFKRLLSHLDIPITFQVIGLVSALPLILDAALEVVTPDLLQVLVLLWLLYLLLINIDRQELRITCLIGLLGGLSYLAKSYGFIFFIAYFSFYCAISCLFISPERVISQWLAGFVIFLAVCAIWIYFLDHKYGTFIISNAAEFNHALIAPNGKGNPIHYMGLLPPPNSSATSAWEDPGILPVNHWSPFSSFDNFAHQSEVVGVNLVTAFSILVRSALGGFLLTLYALIKLFPLLKERNTWKKPVVLMSVFALVYLSGYLAISVVPRYIWIVHLLLLCIGLLTFNDLLGRRSIGGVKSTLLILLFATSFVYPSIEQLVQHQHYGKDLFISSQQLRTEHLIKEGYVASTGNWPQSLYLCYYLNKRYYGETGMFSGGADQLQRQFVADSIKYCFVWNRDSVLPFMNNPQIRVLTSRALPELQIYEFP
jgi:hypothetical protein